MSSSRSSTVSGGQHKKILRTRVKVLAKYQLRQGEAFDIDKADQLIRRAVADKASITTVMKLFGDGLRFGMKGVLSPLLVEFVSYPSITAFISLRELPTVLALCLKIGPAYGVAVVQFKDLEALQVVCEVIDRQRSLMTGAVGRGGASPTSSIPASSVSRVEVTAQQPPKPMPTVVVTADADPPPPAAVTVTVATSEVAAVEERSAVVVAGSSSGSNGLFEQRPFAAEITQPPAKTDAVTSVVVHESAAPRPDNDNDIDDDDNFRASIVFGSSSAAAATEPSIDESVERQRRMESVLLRAANGGGGRSGGAAIAASSGSSAGSSGRAPIETVILNYDDVDTEGTHAVFDSPDGPPVQLNESAVNLRRPESLRVTPSVASDASAAADSRPRGSRLVVTSFSSGCSEDSPDGTGQIQLRSSSGEQSYRTSTVIYRDAPSTSSQLLDSPTDRPRVTYVSNQRASPAQPSPQYQQYQQYQQPQQQQQQSMQLVRLVPVGSARRRVVQQQPQYYTIQPVGARENGLHMVAK